MKYRVVRLAASAALAVFSLQAAAQEIRRTGDQRPDPGRPSSIADGSVKGSIGEGYPSLAPAEVSVREAVPSAVASVAIRNGVPVLTSPWKAIGPNSGGMFEQLSVTPPAFFP